MPVHCKKQLEGLVWISAFKSKKLDLLMMHTTHFRTFHSQKISIFKISHCTVVTHCSKINKYKTLYLRNRSKQLKYFNGLSFYDLGHALHKNCEPIFVNKCALSKKSENFKFYILVGKKDIVLTCLSFTCFFVMAVLSWLSCTGCPLVMIVLGEIPYFFYLSGSKSKGSLTAVSDKAPYQYIFNQF